MRFLHTSDWHLGRSFHGAQLLDAQVRVLESIVERVREDGVEVVVVAGDLYDRAIPSADAVAALDHLLSEIRGAGARIVGIAGNHDSSVRVGFGERLLAAGGVSIRGDVRSAGKPVLVPEADGSTAVAFYPVPYLEPETARHALGEPDARTHERLLDVALGRARQDLEQRPGTRSVAVLHAFVTGGQSSESELALSVGGSAEVPLRKLRGFDYVALGHLHGRQAFGDGQARYSGSPLPYSFSERNHTKGAWLVDLGNEGTVRAEPVDFPVHRPLAQLRGPLEDLLVHPDHEVATGSYVHAVLTDDVLPMDAMAKLRHRFPHAVHLTHEPAALPLVGSYAERVRGRDDLDLAKDFIEHVTGCAASLEQEQALTAVIEQSPGSREEAAA